MKHERVITLKQFYDLTPAELYDLYPGAWGKGGCANYSVDVDGDTSFVCMIGPQKKEKWIWADDGSTSVSLVGVKSYSQLLDRCKGYKRGDSFCVRCGNRIKRGDKAHNWFGDIICADCWTSSDEKNRNWDYDHLD